MNAKMVTKDEVTILKINVTKERKCLKVGILGCGTISQAAHLEAAVKARNIELVAICDVAEEVLMKMAAVYGPQRVYSDYAGMLEDPELEAVIIGIGDQFHAACTKQALMAEKHVLVEKPLGVMLEECEELQRIAKEKGLVVQVGNMKRFDGGLQFARKFVREEIGEVTTFKAWYCDSTGRYQVCDNVMPPIYSSPDMKKPEGNPKADMEKYYLLGHASHLFDTARYLMGDITSVEVKHAVKANLYSWLIACDFENGAIGNLDLTIAVRADWHEGFQIYGTNGTVLAKTYNPWILRTSEVECCNESTGLIKKPYIPDGHFYRRQLEGFAEVILEGKEQTGASLEDGTAALRAIIATYESLRNNGRKTCLRAMKGGI